MNTTRRHFLHASLGLVAGYHIASNVVARPDSPRLRFAVIGISHEHIFRMVKAVRDGGGELALVYAPDAEPHLAAKFFRDYPNVKRARSEQEVLEASGISLVVSTARPTERAALGIRVMQAGKDFLADKGGFLTLEALDAVRRVQAQTRRIYSISYNERLLDHATVKAGDLVRAGAIGRVIRTEGDGPHGLTHNPREPWFWTRVGRGGIWADVGTHQADQFLFFTGSTRAEVVSARAANLENPNHPEFEDFGEATFKGDRGDGHARISFYRETSKGMHLTIHGTAGRIEVIKGQGRLKLIDSKGERTVAVDTRQPCPFGKQLVDDVLNRTETAMPQKHAFLASELAVRAQLTAKRGDLSLLSSQ